MCLLLPLPPQLQGVPRLSAHRLWQQSRRPLALALHSRIADVFAVDIHPAAKIGKGILFDHAAGVVVGETAVIGNNVSILHHLTLGGTGKMGGDSHPKKGDGVLIGAGATILGNVKIGEVGNPARLVGGKEKPSKHEDVPGESMDHTSSPNGIDAVLASKASATFGALSRMQIERANVEEDMLQSIL
ncbi:hypothetical protein L6164_001114 [Bauhinia variegata]|uniref:Uncharacterized protein n=1 Tax=Bauhinia variegata TaxID=167791 RepID=A0ACB9Q824_BAUVA|nr:hypothetical protein L6164_001114 [Bauhinia variegata]